MFLTFLACLYLLIVRYLSSSEHIQREARGEGEVTSARGEREATLTPKNGLTDVRCVLLAVYE